MFSEKYLAGLIDADGHISVRGRTNASKYTSHVGCKVDLEFSISQASGFSEPLEWLKENFGGCIREKCHGQHLEYLSRGNPAMRIVERVKNHLVLKQGHAEAFLKLVQTGTRLYDESDLMAFREHVKELRATEMSYERNYPSRKWMAGYIDGDGSFSAALDRYGNARPVLSIAAAQNYPMGILLLQKAFGGSICKPSKGNYHLWQLSLFTPSKIKQVVDFCGPYLIRKWSQAYFLKGCVEGGKLRDGATVNNTLKVLNAQQQRLSDPAIEVSRLLDAFD